VAGAPRSGGTARADDGGLGRTRADRSSVDWRTLLSGASPREVLARLVANDALQLRRRIGELLAERCYVLDADAVFLRAVARVSRFSTRYRGEPPLDDWLRSQIDDAIGDCLMRERATPPNAPCDEPEDPGSAFTEFARPLGLDPMRMRAACAALNALGFEERAAFFSLVLDRQPLEESAARAQRTPTEWARAARRALDACMSAAIALEEPAARALRPPAATDGASVRHVREHGDTPLRESTP